MPGGRHAVFIAPDVPNLVSAPDGGPVAAGRLDLFVAAQAGVSRTQAATLIATGHVTVNGRAEKASYRLRPGDRVEVVQPPPPGRAVIAESIPLRVVYEDEWLLVVDKPAGMVVHPAPGHWSGTLVNALLGRQAAEAGGESARDHAGMSMRDGRGRPRPYRAALPDDPAGAAGGAGEDESGADTEAIPGDSPDDGSGVDQPSMRAEERAGLVHRLDKDTSGLLVVAKTTEVHRRLSAALAQRRIRRLYAVLSWGHLSRERLTVESPIGRDPRDRKRMAIVTTGRSARTDFVRLARFDSTDLLRARLSSGRTHQIRVHLASVGHPVVGDDTYGGKGRRTFSALPPHRHFLHAAWLVLEHPVTGQLLDLRSPLPPDLSRALAAAAGDGLAGLGVAAGEGDLEAEGGGDVLDHVGFYRPGNPDR